MMTLGTVKIRSNPSSSTPESRECPATAPSAVCQSGVVPRFEPFQGLRYRPDVAPMAQVIAPPYDVISPTERSHLASRHRANAVLVELPEADLSGGRDRYAVATDLFVRWQEKGILLPDPGPSLYPYRMTDPSGRATTGVIGALGLADPGKDSDILPHEQTLPKPKSDRLDLLRATRANLSPIWGLSMAPGVTATFDPTDDDPVADVYDDDGVRHQLWVLSDADTVAAVGTALAPRRWSSPTGTTATRPPGLTRQSAARPTAAPPALTTL